ncbi:MBL fold metallo-hydrolase [Halobacillus salinus]|uniref:MBL fold metallo-hydrolase n=1 Tax=Halobacillus salinus TaxID=192814 RepID=UPI0009A7E642|nr:MBL fold metallo-hydrolase [Halobacillus salinus]
MSFQQIQNDCYYYHSSVNIGYVKSGSYGMLIDAGLDKSSIKKVLKELESHELPLTHLFITHAHSDHYGGAKYIQDQYSVHTIAPVLEEAILRYPSIEPLYLFGGNDPIDELQNKFLQGPPVRIDEVITETTFQFGDKTCDTFLLPGHSYHQLALRVDGILFAADSYFSEETLKKHKIPFLTDAHLALRSLERLATIDCEIAVPGHGEQEEDPSSTISANISCHKEIMEWIHEYVVNHELISHEQLVSEVCNHYKVKASQLSQWLLYRTAVSGYLVGLLKEGKLEQSIEDNRWVFKSR